mgnify:CR=1 FL=1
MKNLVFLNKLDVCNKLKCSKTSIYNYVVAGTLPPAITMNGKNKWFEHEIEEIMQQLAAGTNEESLKLIVKRQILERLCDAA